MLEVVTCKFRHAIDLIFFPPRNGKFFAVLATQKHFILHILHLFPFMLADDLEYIYIYNHSVSAFFF